MLQQKQFNLEEMEKDLREIKVDLLRILKETNPIAYLEFLGKIMNEKPIVDEGQ